VEVSEPEISGSLLMRSGLIGEKGNQHNGLLRMPIGMMSVSSRQITAHSPGNLI
jgi:hypothetical protein